DKRGLILLNPCLQMYRQFQEAGRLGIGKQLAPVASHVPGTVHRAQRTEISRQPWLTYQSSALQRRLNRQPLVSIRRLSTASGLWVLAKYPWLLKTAARVPADSFRPDVSVHLLKTWNKRAPLYRARPTAKKVAHNSLRLQE